MANARKNNIKRFIETISPAVAEDAYHGGGESATFIRNGKMLKVDWNPILEVLKKEYNINPTDTFSVFEEFEDYFQIPLFVEVKNDRDAYQDFTVTFLGIGCDSNSFLFGLEGNTGNADFLMKSFPEEITSETTIKQAFEYAGDVLTSKSIVENATFLVIPPFVVEVIQEN